MFVFKGISSIEMNVIEQEEDFTSRASQRYEAIEIEGRNGAYFEENGYSVVEKKIKLQVLDTSKMDKIFEWLNGFGILEYQGRITKARFYSELSPVRSSNIKTIDATFIRDPFWSKKRDEYITVTDIVLNEGNIYSDPIIRLEKNTSNTLDVTINDVRFTYNFNNESYVEINCEEQTVEYEGLNRNRKIEIGYKFPSIAVGVNKIITHSGDATIKIKKKDRWL